MAAELDGVEINLLRFCQVAEGDFDQRQMPAQMAVEKPFARIRREPVQQKGARRTGFAVFVADMGKPVCAVRVSQVERHRPLDFGPGRRESAVFRKRHRVIDRGTPRRPANPRCRLPLRPTGTKTGLQLCNVSGTLGVVDSPGTFTLLT
jgi:hypothetical protein